jgi:RNA polymerase sigma-70 factor (ECF subfamily)
MDAAQEAFLRVHKYFGAYDAEAGDFGAWLHRIVVNTSRKIAAERKRTGQISDRMPEGRGSMTNADAESGSATDRRVLQRALGALTEKERAAFVLRDLDGLPTEEVARTLDMSPATVRVHICMARKKMRPFFEEDPG